MVGKNIFLILLGFVLGYLVFHKGCGANVINTKYDTLYKKADTVTIKKDTVVYKKGDDIFHERTIYVDVPAYKLVDTAAIIKNFFANNIYKDTLTLSDSLGWVAITDTIAENKLKGRTWSSSIKQQKITETILVSQNFDKNILLGVSLIGMKIPEISLLYSKDMKSYYKVGYSTQGISVGFFKKLR